MKAPAGSASAVSLALPDVAISTERSAATPDSDGAPETAADVVSEKQPPASEPSGDLPFAITISPPSPTAGETITLTFSGELAPEWLYGADAYIDQRADNRWHTKWTMLNTSFSQVATAVDASAPPMTVPAIGYDLSSASSFVLPRQIAPGPYRVCVPVARSQSSSTGYFSGRACTELTIV